MLPRDVLPNLCVKTSRVANHLSAMLLNICDYKTVKGKGKNGRNECITLLSKIGLKTSNQTLISHCIQLHLFSQR